VSDFSVLFAGDALPQWREYAVAADDSGFWGLGIGDSQSIYPDVYVRCAIAALETVNLHFGPWVTNSVTRHPAVTAGAISTVDQLSGGRAVLGIGTGDSALANLGLKPTSLRGLEEYVATVNALLTTGRAVWRSDAVQLDIGQLGRPKVPVYVAASGPRTLQLAGRIADGVVIGTGVLPEVAADALAHLRSGAEQAGRSVDNIDVWWLLMTNLAEDDGTALAEIENSLITYMNLAFRFTTEGKHLPAEFVAAVQTVHAEYRAMEHAKFGEGHHTRLARELGVTPYLRERFSLPGTPDGFVQRAQRLRAVGIDKIWLSMRAADKGRFLRLWNEAVRPALT